jgi:TRAP transporter TAXI family solute receptor
MGARFFKLLLVIALFAGALAGIVWGVTQVAGPSPPGRIVIATGDPAGSYDDLARTYRNDLERNGVELELRDSKEGFATLRALLDPKSGINAGFLKGGLVGSLQGRLATDRARDWHERELAQLKSVGRMFYEPIWVFTRDDLPIDSLRDLKGKRVLIGSREGGTRRIARQLLKANGVDAQNTAFIDGVLAADAGALRAGEADGAFLIAPADSEVIQKLLRQPGIRLMNFAPEIDAYTNRFPALTRVILRRGGAEFDPLIPTDDITLLSTTAALVIRADLHPALVSLLTYAAISNPKPGFDKLGDPVLFYRAGEFPSANDPEFDVAKDARLIYRSGEMPFLLRALAPVNKRLGVPFSVTAFTSSYGAQTILLLIPTLSILLPLIRFGPVLYNWSIRRRLLYWYRQLKSLEARLEAVRDGDRKALQAEIDRIDAGVRRIRVPLAYSNQLYDLREHTEFVRRRIAGDQQVLRVAAE